MKLSRIFIVSLGVNFLLAVILAWAVQRRAAAPQIDASDSASNRIISVAPPAASIIPETPTTLTNEVTTPFHWSLVESPDYRAYMDNLRAIGCPEQRIRDIIIADVDALFAERARDYIAPLQSRFWELAAQPRDLEKVVEEHQQALRKMESEREQIFQALFNESNPRRSWRNTRRELSRNSAQYAQLDFLDESQRAAVLALQAELASALSAARNLELTGTPEEIRRQRDAKEREIRTASDEKLRALLTPEEFAEYKLRDSRGAAVRHQLARMTLAESEARSIAQLVTARTDAEAALDSKNPATKSTRAQLEQQTQDQIKQLLGETRYAEYQRASDGRYSETARIIERLQLPEQTAIAVYQARLEAEKLATQLRGDRSASADERNAALKIIRTEAERSVRQLVGADAFKDYQNNAGGWFEGLSRPAK